MSVWFWLLVMFGALLGVVAWVARCYNEVETPETNEDYLE